MEELRNEQGQTLSEFLASYDENRYRHPSATVDMAVFTMLPEPLGLSVLLVKRRNHPYIGQWALPGGFVEIEEDLPDAAARELHEETSLSGIPLRPFGSFGAVDRDPRTRVITNGFYAVAPMGSLAPAAGDDAADARLFRISLKRIAKSAPADTYELRLTNGDTVLTDYAQLRYDELGAVPAHVSGGSLASDHGLILFSALYALSLLPPVRTATVFTKGTQKHFGGAVRLLSHLFPEDA